MSCPACGKFNTPETAVPFPADSARFVRYCLQLNIDPKKATAIKKKALICFEHFDAKDLVKTNGKVTGVSRVAIPVKAKKQLPQPTNQKQQQEKNKDMSAKGQTLDQLLAQNVGIGISNAATTSSRLTTNLGSKSATNSQQIGIFGLPRAPQTNSSGTISSGVHPMKTFGLSELANRTIVIYRQKKPGASPTLSGTYFREWLLNSFNLPAAAIHEQSQVVNVADLCFNYLLLDEKRTIETILTMYRSTPPNTYQCLLDSALNILMEGGQILRKEQKNGGKKEMDLDECFGLLLPTAENNPPTTSATEMEMRMEVDDTAWNNIAAAMMPMYRMMANSPQSQQNDAANLPIPSFAASMMNPTTSQSSVPSFANLMQQIDQTNRPPQPSRIPRPR